MPRKPYRVEVNYPKTGKPKYFLVKDIKVKGKKRKVRKYIGVIPPTKEIVERYRELYAYDMEIRAAEKRAELSTDFYKREFLTDEYTQRIETIHYIYKAFTELLTVSETAVYERNFEVTYVQGTTSIEGNTITEEQTYNLIVNGIIPENKSLREINEVQNFIKVKNYRDHFRGKITLDFVKTLHAFIMNNIDFESAGVFRRTDDVGIVGCDLAVTPSILIEKELQKIIEDYYIKIQDGWHPFEAAVLFHYHFEMIHPFMDGNGRVGREIFNYMLMRAGYPKLLFLGGDRELYIQSLRFGNDEKYSDMIDIFCFLINKQRYNVLRENLEKVVIPPKKTGQVRLTDFVFAEPIRAQTTNVENARF